jgi:hypothetical protein
MMQGKQHGHMIKSWLSCGVQEVGITGYHVWSGFVASATGYAVLQLPHWCRIGVLQLLHGLMCSCGPLAEALLKAEGGISA